MLEACPRPVAVRVAGARLYLLHAVRRGAEGGVEGGCESGPRLGADAVLHNIVHSNSKLNANLVAEPSALFR